MALSSTTGCEQNLDLLVPEGWTEAADSSNEVEPPLKRKRLSLKKTADVCKSSGSRFLSPEEEAALSDKCIPKNTATSTKWAVANFESWRKRRNEGFVREPGRQVPDGLLLGVDNALLCKWLCCYVAEARKQDGSLFPPKSLYLLLTGLLRFMRSKNPHCPNFLDTEKLEFVSFHNAMDNVFRKLRAQGISVDNKPTEAFSKDEIEQLWASRSLCSDTPKGLLRAVFFLNGIGFCLRGGEEHRNLKISQLKRENDPPKYVYTELASKNRAGGLAQLRVKNKSVSIFAAPEAGDRCHVFLLDLYFSKLPKEAFERDIFYLQPISKVCKPGQPWFTTTAVGKNTLAKMVKDVCADAGIGGNKTNHSLRATGATELYQAGVPEKVIQERTGHLSLTGLRQYERTSDKQHEAASHVLAAKENVSYQQQVTMKSHSVVPMAMPPPQYSFSNCNVTFNSLPPAYQLPVSTSSVLYDVTNSVTHD